MRNIRERDEPSVSDGRILLSGRRSGGVVHADRIDADMVSKLPSGAPPGTPFMEVSDTRLRALTEHALEIITVQDAKGIFTYANDAVARYLGYGVDELVGANA